ncbi:MAG: DUF2182 domain-containing protein [Myxococcales bacterium]|nr:DUF2182 domain-containing protein [Myxococcales bacterium]
MLPSRDDALAALLRRDRRVVIAGMIGVAALAWGYTIVLAGHDAAGHAAHMGPMLDRPWSAADLAMTFAMWVVMMVAMMLPTAAPMVAALVGISRSRHARSEPFTPATAFVAGYLIVWTGYSLLATLAQWRLHQAALISAAGVSTSALLGGSLLLAAGIFQLTPLKHACLRHCRSPLAFLLTEWRPGAWGALRMGLKHGLYCAGCCWALMALMFFAGTMNLLWIAGLALLMLVEKALPGGRQVGHAAGVVLVLWSLHILATAALRS